MLENSESEDKHTFGFNKTVNYDECVNHLSNPDNLVPGKYLFIRGNPFCGVNRSGNGTYTVENSVLLDAGTTFADLSLFDGNDLPHCQIWSDTVYFPTDGVSLLDIRVQGSGNYVLSGSTCSPPIYTVSVDDVLSHFMGYTTHNNRKIYYIGSDSFFDYEMINHEGAWHAREFQRIHYTTTEPARQAVGSLIEIILNS